MTILLRKRMFINCFDRSITKAVKYFLCQFTETTVLLNVTTKPLYMKDVLRLKKKEIFAENLKYFSLACITNNKKYEASVPIFISG